MAISEKRLLWADIIKEKPEYSDLAAIAKQQNLSLAELKELWISNRSEFQFSGRLFGTTSSDNRPEVSEYRSCGCTSDYDTQSRLLAQPPLTTA